jgi:hypothetical protein
VKVDAAAPSYIYIETADNEISGMYDLFTRSLFFFNTTEIPDGATISGATFSVRQYTGTSGLGSQPYGITSVNISDDVSSLTTGHYQAVLDTTLSDSYIAPSNAWKNFTLNAAGISEINKTAFTHISVRFQADVENNDSAITWKPYSNLTRYGFYTVESAANHPTLTIDFIPEADTTPPASITNLANVTTCNSINWTWTDSISDDADVVQIWQNGTFLHNVSANQTYDLWSGLAAELEYTFSSHTCDLTGNCNTTWVNLSSTTPTCETGCGLMCKIVRYFWQFRLPTRLII